jgi:hypothetical protein
MTCTNTFHVEEQRLHGPALTLGYLQNRSRQNRLKAYTWTHMKRNFTYLTINKVSSYVPLDGFCKEGGQIKSNNLYFKRDIQISTVYRYTLVLDCIEALMFVYLHAIWQQKQKTIHNTVMYSTVGMTQMTRHNLTITQYC